MRRFTKLSAFFFFCFYLVSQFVIMASAQTLVQARLSAREVAQVLQNSLRNTRIKLHNFGDLKQGSYYQDGGSYVIIGKGVGGNGKKVKFILPEISKKIGRGHYSYLINDIRSLKPRVRAHSKGFIATIPFETKGAEMVGRCTAYKMSFKFWDRKNRKIRPCKGLMGAKIMPDIHWVKPAIEIAFKPRRYGDSMTFYIDKISIKGEIDAGKVCGWKLVGKRICGQIEQLKVQIKKQVSAMLMAQLSTPKVRHAIAKDIQRRIDRKTGTSILKIKRVSMNRGVIRVALGF